MIDRIKFILNRFIKYDTKYKNKIINLFNHCKHKKYKVDLLLSTSRNLLFKLYNKNDYIEIEFHKEFVSIYYIYYNKVYYEEISKEKDFKYIFDILVNFYERNDKRNAYYV